MHKHFVAGLSLLTVLLVVCLDPRCAVAGDMTGGIRGVVVDEMGGATYPGTIINVTSPSVKAQAVAGRGGFFAILGLPPDAYTVTYKLPLGRFAGCWVRISVQAGEVTSLHLVAYQQSYIWQCPLRPVSVRVDADQTGSGYTFGADGNPLP